MASKTNSSNGVTFAGTSDADTLTNSGNNVTINAGAGNDKISLGSNVSVATINAGTGNDTIYASTGGTNYGGRTFQYADGDGDDIIFGFTANDTLKIFAESHQAERVDDDIIVTVGTGKITLKNVGDISPYIRTILKNGTENPDTISNVAHGMILNGFGGNDSITNSGRYVTINAGAGSDKISNEGSYTSISAGDGDDFISNANIGDYSFIDGGAGADSIYSADEDGSTVSGGAGNDTLRGTYYSSSVNGGSGDDFIFVNYLYNSTINGGDGNDFISVSGGSYGGTILGGTGNDTIISASGTYGKLYQYFSGDGNDLITGFHSNDTLQISGGTYTTLQSGADLILSVGNGSVTLKNALPNLFSQVRIKNADNSFTMINPVQKRSGTANNDSISNDINNLPLVINGYEGNDTISNSGKYVTISGDEGNDKIYNTAERVSISGGADNDSIYNNSSYSTVDAGAGNDTIKNYGYNNKIFGGDGNDSIYNWNNNATLDGGNGNDTLDIHYNNSTSSSVNGGAGNDFIRIYESYSSLFVQGGKGDDTIAGDTRGHIFQYAQGDGNDLITGFNSNDTLQITSGTFTTQKSGSDFIISVGEGNITLKGAATQYGKLQVLDAENVLTVVNAWSIMQGTANNDSLSNIARKVTVSGLAGNDSIRSSYAYYSTIDAGAGNDTIYSNYDYYSSISGGAGNDSIYNNYSQYSTLSGGDGNDTIRNYGYASKVFGDDGNDYIYNNNSYVSIYGGAGADTIVSYDDYGLVNGGAGNDSISLQSSNNYSATIIGGEGNDTIRATGTFGRLYKYGIGDGDDIIFGFGENDTIHIAAEKFTTSVVGSDVVLNVDRGTVTLKDALGKVSNVKAVLRKGTSANDSMTNFENDVIIDAAAGNDTVDSRGNNVSISAGDGNDSIKNSGSNVTIDAGSGNDTISGGSYANIFGGDGNDSITVNYGTVDGGAGDDKISGYGSLSGGAGNDSIRVTSSSSTISGGTGNDTISNSSSYNVYQFGSGDGNDLITGFNLRDTLQITSGNFSTLQSGNDLIVSVEGGAVTLKGALENPYNKINLLDETGNLIILNDWKVMEGTDAADTLSNSADNVTVSALAGNDYIYNSGSTVKVYGGEGNDYIYNSGAYSKIDAGSGNDSIYNGNSHTTIYGGADNDSIYSWSSYTTISGGDGNDTIKAYDYYGSISGGAGNDFISLNSNSYYNTVSGGTGNDTIQNNNSTSYGNVYEYAKGDGNDLITGVRENDTLKISGGYFTTVQSGSDLIVKVGSENITLKGATPIILGAEKPSVISGTNSADSISNDLAEIFIDALDGNDTISNQPNSDYVFIDAGAGNDSVQNNYSYNVTISGGDGSDTIENISGRKVSISGGSGSDFIKTANSTLNGAAVYSAEVTINGGSGNDFISLASNGNLIQYAAGDGSDTISGLSANDTIQITGGKYKMAKKNDNVIISVGEEDITLIDFESEDFFVDGEEDESGDDEPSTLTGTAKADKLSNDKNNAFISALAGNDSISNSGSNVTISGGKGNDTISNTGSANVYQYASGEGKDVIVGFAEDDTLQISSSKYTYSWSKNDLVVKVGSGTITLKDAATLPVISVQNSSGTVEEIIPPPILPDGWKFTDADFTAIKATLKTAASVDLNDEGYENIETVDGTSATGDLTILGNDADNLLKGGKGADILDGGAGDDTLTGGNGSDIFVYSGGDDVITDYKVGQDTIQVDNSIEIDFENYAIKGKDLIYSTSEGEILIKNGKQNLGKIVFVDEDGNARPPIPTLPEGWKYSANGKTLTATLAGAEDLDLLEGVDENGNLYGEGVENVDGAKLTGNIEIIGNDLDNSLKGGKGNDILDGGAGDDTLTGGKGADIFVFSGGNDLIADYKAGEDIIQISSDVDWSNVEAVISGKNTIFKTAEGNLTVKGVNKLQSIIVVDEDGNQLNPVVLPEGWSFDAKSTKKITAPNKKSSVDDINLTEENEQGVLFGNGVVTLDGTNAVNDFSATGNDEDNVIIGGAGENTLDGGEGNDTLTGGKGADIFVYNGGLDVITDFEEGVDTIQVDTTEVDWAEFIPTVKGTDILFKFGEENSLTLKKAKGKEVVIIDEDGEQIYPEQLSPLPEGWEYVEGSDGTEIVASDTEAENIDLFDGTYGGDIVKVNGSAVENDLEVIGNDLGNHIITGAGQDTIFSGNGDDSLYGGDGNDVFILSGGNDVIYDFNSSSDEDDEIRLDTDLVTYEDYSFNGENLIISTDKGQITVEGARGKEFHLYDYEGDEISMNPDLPDGVEAFGETLKITKPYEFEDDEIDLSDYLTFKNIDASEMERGIKITGNAEDNSIVGGKDDDTIIGGGGDDTFVGGGGQDTFIFSGGNIVIEDLNYQNDGDIIKIDASQVDVKNLKSRIDGKDVIVETSDGEITIKNAVNKKFYIFNEKNKVAFQYPEKIEVPYGWNLSGNDTILTATKKDADDINLAEENSDEIIYGAEVVKVDASKVTSELTVIGNDLNNSIKGGSGADYLDGSDGNDIILGNNGADTLYGSEGNDTLTGGAGNDVFVYDGGDDVITDYTYNKTQHDKIVIDTDHIALVSVETVGTNLVYTTDEGDTLTVKNAKKYAADILIVDNNGSEYTPDLWFTEDDENYLTAETDIDSISEITADYSAAKLEVSNPENLAQSETFLVSSEK